MMNSHLLIIATGILATAVHGLADSVAHTLDGGGRNSAAGAYVNDGSITTFAGISSSGSSTNRCGYIGQLTELTSLVLTGTPARVNETTTTQLSGAAIMGDATITVLSGNEVLWGTAVWPVSSINSNGVASTAIVYQDTPMTLNGSYLGVANTGTLLVVNTIPDNYGSYANDGLPDAWQYTYFGLNNTNAAPTADPTSCGQNNLFKYIAGLNPTNAASLFQFRIELVQGQPYKAKLIFSPRWNDRTYIPIFTTNLAVSASWTNLLTTTITDNATERTLTDTNSLGTARFYRIRINYP
jgi:hypothetical protein